MPSLVAFVPQESLADVIAATSHAVVPVTVPAALSRAIAAGSAKLLILDPINLRDDSFREVLGISIEAGVSLLIWARLTPVVAARVVVASRLLPVEVLFREFDSLARRLPALMRDGASATAPALVLHGLSPHIAQLRDSMRRPILACFGGARTPASVGRLAARIGCSRRTLERALHDVGLRGAKRMLAVVRIAHSWRALARAEDSLDEVAERAGYESVRTLTHSYHTVVGLAPRRAARSLTTEAFALRLVEAARAVSASGQDE